MKLKDKIVELWNMYSVYVAVVLVAAVIASVLSVVLWVLQFFLGADVTYVQCFLPLFFIISLCGWAVIRYNAKLF